MVVRLFCCHAGKGEENSDDLPLAPSSEKLIESIPQEVNACEEKVTFTNDDLILGDTPHNCPVYLVGYMHDERVNQILFNGGSSMNILPIRTVKELGIQPRGKRAIGAIRLGITIEDMQSSAWLHVIDAKTSYNVLIGRPWIHKNKVVPSTYHEYLKYYKGEVEKKIVTDDELFTEAESHFADIKFYLKNRIVKELKTGIVKNDESTTKRAEVVADKTEVVTEEIFAKAGYNPNEPSKLGNLLRGNHVKVKPYTVVYTKEHGKDEESMGSSYYVTAQGENGVPSLMEDNDKLEGVLPCYHISFNDEDPQEDEDAKDASPELEEGVKATIDALKEVNLGTDEEPRPTYLSALLAIDEESTNIELLKEFKNVFAWSYKEMLGLDPKVAVHHLAVKNGVRPVKQAQRRFRPDLVSLIKSEVNKLIEAGFICEVKYPTWVSSIVTVRKKNGQIRVCVDFRDLNNACTKDEFPLPIPKLMIDTTTGYKAMSFMDGSSGCNQIHMAPKDEELMTFRTPKNIYFYRVMPFGLNNAGATYQRAMLNIFDDLLYKNVECYVDNLVVKSRKMSGHLIRMQLVNPSSESIRNGCDSQLGLEYTYLQPVV
ncbi:uncharacterized protein [Nicotiana tomentosiformis]|uniref:uncharacterized protein n=1 Tax=Nicotiana tomentosiformis TaxID=4098 RepID=UPI00388CE6F6